MLLYAEILKGISSMDRKKKAATLLLIYSFILYKFNSKKQVKIYYNEEFDGINNNHFASIDEKNILFVNDKDMIIDDDNIYVIDYRNVDDPNMTIWNSYKIISLKEMRSILEVLKEYENKYPSNWNRTINSMEYEWILHNVAYYLNIFTNNSKDVDLNNEDEGKLIPKFEDKIKEKVFK